MLLLKNNPPSSRFHIYTDRNWSIPEQSLWLRLHPNLQVYPLKHYSMPPSQTHRPENFTMPEHYWQHRENDKVTWNSPYNEQEGTDSPLSCKSFNMNEKRGFPEQSPKLPNTNMRRAALKKQNIRSLSKTQPGLQTSDRDWASLCAFTSLEGLRAGGCGRGETGRETGPDNSQDSTDSHRL